MNKQIDGVDDNVELNQAEEAKRKDVAKLATLWSIAQSQDELEEQKGQVEVFDQSVDNVRGGTAKWERSLTIGVARNADEIENDGGSQPE